MTGQPAPASWIVVVNTNAPYADVLVKDLEERWPNNVTKLFNHGVLATYRIATSDSDVDEILEDGGIIVGDVYPE